MALAAVVALVLALLPIPQELMEAYNNAAVGLGEPGLISALSTVLFAPIAEEVIFRGLVYTRLRRAMPAALACVLSSLVFGLLHGQLLWIAYAFIMGARAPFGQALSCMLRSTLWAHTPCNTCRAVFSFSCWALQARQRVGIGLRISTRAPDAGSGID